MSDFHHPVRHAHVSRVNDVPREPAIRVYKSSPDEWTIQVRGPKGLAGLKEGKDFRALPTAALVLPCPKEPAPAMLAGMSKPPSPIQVVSTGTLWRLTRPGARYAVTRRGEEHSGVWLPDGLALPPATVDTFAEEEARSLLSVLRALEDRPMGKGGRPAQEPTTPDGKLIARACKALGLPMSGLAAAIDVDKSQLSRAMAGELPGKHREAIKALLATRRKKPVRTT